MRKTHSNISDKRLYNSGVRKQNWLLVRRSIVILLSQKLMWSRSQGFAIDTHPYKMFRLQQQLVPFMGSLHVRDKCVFWPDSNVVSQFGFSDSIPSKKTKI